jgi:hypothetical protein
MSFFKARDIAEISVPDSGAHPPAIYIRALQAELHTVAEAADVVFIIQHFNRIEGGRVILLNKGSILSIFLSLHK